MSEVGAEVLSGAASISRIEDRLLYRSFVYITLSDVSDSCYKIPELFKEAV